MDDLQLTWANSPHSLIVAPAGCGKTHLISLAVNMIAGCQLILTHTHAGVKAIRERMGKMGVNSSRYRVTTIDSFALRYAAAFPTLSGWRNLHPEGVQWEHLRPSATKTLKSAVAIKILTQSYKGVFVDEYQDCTIGQHQLILQLASILPCRILGDPLQAIFQKLNRYDRLNWAVVETDFKLLGELKTPHRWVNKHPKFGEWLLSVREDLFAGNEIDLRLAPGIDFTECEPTEQEQVKACLRLAKLPAGHTGVGLKAWRHNCHRLSGRLKNMFITFEDSQCEDLIEWARVIEKQQGGGRAAALCEFADKWLTNIPMALIKGLLKRVVANEQVRAQRKDIQRIAAALNSIRDNDNLHLIVEALDAFAYCVEKPTYCSREIWFGMRSSAALVGLNATLSLSEAALQYRSGLQNMGRTIANKALSTPLLVKGLEFDEVAILDVDDFPESESLYVAITRAVRRLRVLGKKPIIKRVLSLGTNSEKLQGTFAF